MNTGAFLVLWLALVAAMMLAPAQKCKDGKHHSMVWVTLKNLSSVCVHLLKSVNF